MDEGGSVDEVSLFPKRLRGGVLGGSFFTGDAGRHVKKASGCRHGGPFVVEGNPVCGGARITRTLIDE